MSLLAVELNDAGLLLVRTGDDGVPVLAGEESPGLAVLHEGRVHVGGEAVRRYRIAPLHAQNRFWQALSLDALPWSARGIATAADLAHAHLSALLTADARHGAEELLLAVPPGYTREQLGLLVGVANECGVSVRGLVDAGLAAVATVAPAPCLLHLDLQLHQASATLIEASRAEGTLRRTRYELLPGAGVLALRQVMAESIATAFVRETRFDPLHQAASEQRLHDLLPSWLQALATADEIAAEIELGSTTHRISLTRAQLEAAVERLSDDILRLVQAARPPGTALHLCFSPRVASIPGLVGRLGCVAGLRRRRTGAGRAGDRSIARSRSHRPSRGRDRAGAPIAAGGCPGLDGNRRTGVDLRCPPMPCRRTCCSAGAPGRSPRCPCPWVGRWAPRRAS